MTERYDPAAIEKKWQERWEADRLHEARDDDPRPKFYFLTMLPYTSGDLHIGHWYAMAPSDVRARWLRMRGYNVLFPMGFDAFGLPAENAAIKQNVHPYRWTMDNVERMRRQLRTMGASFDWSREVVTCLPEYYRWNQWFFLKMYERGLAYRATAPANWCPSCQTVLANEQVVGGLCERCETPVTRRDLEQWFLRITRYAEELLDHSRIDWPEPVVLMQKNWIGRSEGAEIAFGLHGPGADRAEIRVFTTRPDTLYGATFMVLAPEHPLVERLTTPDHRPEVLDYVEQARRATEIERLSAERERAGVFTGAFCVNPATGREVPIYVADYVLLSYGTGAVMGVPAHDQRDFEFARRYGLPVPVVVAPPGWQGAELEEAYLGPGTMVNSGPFDGLPSERVWRAIVGHLQEQGKARFTVSYRLRDWLISRQRYWGTPIPMIHCSTCGVVPVPEAELPVLLPPDAGFQPTGESPLARHEGFVKASCPRCGGAARRETDTMDTFMDSNWYFLRYIDPQNPREPFSWELARRWLPVDQYTGGAEHAVMHLLYARFFTKVLRELGLLDFDEPFLRLFNQGQILGPDGQRMSKSRGNVVAPDDQVARHGADAFRCALMFLGPWSQGGPFDPSSITGIRRWLARVWNVALAPPPPTEGATPERDLALRRRLHRTLRQVTHDLDHFRFNTMLARLMELTSELVRLRDARTPVSAAGWNEAITALLLMLAPSVPHLAEELWTRRGHPYSVHQQPWPQGDESLMPVDQVTLVVQVNGKVRDRVLAAPDVSEDDARQLALASPKVRAHLDGRRIARVIFVPGRLLNFVVE